jgi:hypothetical protein
MHIYKFESAHSFEENDLQELYLERKLYILSRFDLISGVVCLKSEMSATRPNREGGVDAPGELSEALTTTSYPSNVLNFLRKLRNSPSVQNGSNLNTSPLQAKVCLRIVIVGAGLGGLATSIALARRGHSVVVIEQAQQLAEVRTILSSLSQTKADTICTGRCRCSDSPEFKPSSRTMGCNPIPRRRSCRTS